jgi:hypothetical protein
VVKVAIRPEALKPTSGLGVPSSGAIDAVVERVVFVGAISRIDLALEKGGGRLCWQTTVLPGGERPAPGDRIQLGWRRGDAVVVAVA